MVLVSLFLIAPSSVRDGLFEVNEAWNIGTQPVLNANRLVAAAIIGEMHVKGSAAVSQSREDCRKSWLR
jgi:hypothetical protein